jgi:hypothetical protein
LDKVSIKGKHLCMLSIGTVHFFMGVPMEAAHLHI